MKNPFKHKAFLAIAFSFFGVIIIVLAAFLLNNGTMAVFTNSTELDNCRVRNLLLLQAIDEIGACNPQAAAEIWSSGLVKRSAALQYAVMSSELKAEYIKQLEENSPNWVTGIASPWVDSFKIIGVEHIGDNTSIFTIQFKLMTSTGPAGEYQAMLTVQKQGNYWRIIRISYDEALYPYILFRIDALK